MESLPLYPRLWVEGALQRWGEGGKRRSWLFCNSLASSYYKRVTCIRATLSNGLFQTSCITEGQKPRFSKAVAEQAIAKSGWSVCVLCSTCVLCPQKLEESLGTIWVPCPLEQKPVILAIELSFASLLGSVIFYTRADYLIDHTQAHK